MGGPPLSKRMSYATASFPGDGVTTDFVLPYDYLNLSDLTITVDGVAITSWTEPQHGTIRIIPAPPNPTTVRIIRLTDVSEPAVQLVDGAAFASSDFNTFIDQAIFSIQEMKDLVTDSLNNINAALITAGNFPTVTGADNNSMMVVSAGSWAKLTLAQVKTTLGLPDPFYALPAPGATDYAGVLMPLGGQWSHVTTNDHLRTWLGIDTLHNFTAAYGSPDFATTAFTVMGTAVGNVVQLGTAFGGTPTLPAVSGVNLKDVYINGGYVRIEERTTYNVNGGVYVSPNTWQNRSLTDFTSNEIGASIASGAITLPAGTYQFRAQSYAKGIGFTTIRLVDAGSGGEYVRGVTQYSGTNAATEKVTPDCFGKIVLAAPATIRLQLFGTIAGADDSSMGTAHNTAVLGQNIYTVFELYRVTAS